MNKIKLNKIQSAALEHRIAAQNAHGHQVVIVRFYMTKGACPLRVELLIDGKRCGWFWYFNIWSERGVWKNSNLGRLMTLKARLQLMARNGR